MAEVILIGLGSFGKKVVDLFTDFMDERKYLLTAEQNQVVVHPISFQVNQPFNYGKLYNEITELVKDSDARHFNHPFTYIFVGDLYENGTAAYAVDYAFLPWLFEQTNTLRKKSVLGFFTFSDEVGAVEKCSPETMALIANYFKQIEKIDADNYYQAPFKDSNGIPFQKTPCPYGPFDRNYIVVTPGDNNAVQNETSLVFAERLFYELYYLTDRYESLAAAVVAERGNRDGACFSGFSMIQVSRLDELQHFYLKYLFEGKITDYFLAEDIKGSSAGLEKIKRTFFEMLDIPFETTDFPIDRAVNLFIKNKRKELSNMLNIYESNSDEDVEDYIKKCKERVADKLDDLAPQYDEFVRNEMDWMLNNTLIEGLKNLFKINNLTGNISTYIKYVEYIRDRFASWSNSLKKLKSELPEVSIDEDFKKVQEKIEKIQTSTLYKIPLFVPIRKLLIRNAIYSLPLENYLTTVIKKNLIESLIVQWDDNSVGSRNPVKDCNEVISDLLTLKKKLEDRRKQSITKKQFIENIPNYYYIICQKKPEEYNAILQRIQSINFGTGKQSEIEQLAIDAFKIWTGKAEYLQDITKNVSGFIKHIDDYIEKECARSSFGHIETNTEEASSYARIAVNNMFERANDLNKKSFHTNAETDYIRRDRIILSPKLEREDFLSREITQNTTEINSIGIPREFTLGSVIYFQDYLYMYRTSLQKYENLLNYENVKLNPPIYVSSKEEASSNEVKNEDMTKKDKYVRSILLDVYDEAMTLNLYKEKFAESATKLTPGQVNRLAKAVTVEEVLEKLTDIQLQDYAREIDVRVIADRAEQIKLIAFTISK